MAQTAELIGLFLEASPVGIGVDGSGVEIGLGFGLLLT